MPPKAAWLLDFNTISGYPKSSEKRIAVSPRKNLPFTACRYTLRFLPMTSLTQTAFYTRRVVNIFAICVVGFFIFRAAFKTANQIYRHFVPPPPPPPTTAFGKIPALNFPENKDLPELSFKLETIEGRLPEQPQVGKVYFMPQKLPGLLDLERAIEKVGLFGFKGEGQMIDEATYRWQNETEPITFLEMNIVNGNFHLKHLYEENKGLVDKKVLPTNEQAVAEAKSYLKSKEYLPDDLENGSAEFSYYRFVPPRLEPAISLSEADFLRVNLFRENLDDLKILSLNPLASPVSFLFSGSREINKRIVEVNYRYFPIDRESFATYPLKAIDLAWQELQRGQGLVANLGDNEEGKITIRRVSLAYFEADESQLFLQPIFVFEGDRQFFGYVPAIDSKWLETAPDLASGN